MTTSQHTTNQHWHRNGTLRLRHEQRAQLCEFSRVRFSQSLEFLLRVIGWRKGIDRKIDRVTHLKIRSEVCPHIFSCGHNRLIASSIEARNLTRASFVSGP